MKQTGNIRLYYSDGKSFCLDSNCQKTFVTGQRKIWTTHLLLHLAAWIVLLCPSVSLYADDPAAQIDQRTLPRSPETIKNLTNPYDEPFSPVPSPYSIIVKSSKGSFTPTEMAGSTAKSLTVLGSTEPQYCVNRCVAHGKIYMHFHAGGDNRTYYEHTSSTGWSAGVTVQITGTGSFAASSVTLSIGAAKPEQLYMLDATGSFPGNCTGLTSTTTSSLTFTVTSYTAPSGSPPVASDLRLEVWYVEEVHIDARIIGVSDCGTYGSDLIVPNYPNLIETSDNVVDFQWANQGVCANDSFPNYQFQLLRLYNTSTATTFANDNKAIYCIADWSKALTIETGSKKQELKLTIPEGTGFYAWRVRPIGNYYEGGITNPQNWGCWSNAPNDGTIVQNAILSGGSFLYTSTNGIFFYNQFDEDKNWSYGRTFTEGNDNGPRIGEQIAYTDALGNTTQVQAKIQSKDSVLMGQTVYDYTGRASLSSMVAPVGQNYLQYFTNLLKYNTGSATGLYTAQNFDADANYDDPDPVTDYDASEPAASAISQYYSNMNPNLTIPNADGYPYSRTLFYPDGRIKEQSGVGATHRIGATTPHTSKIYYSSVTEKELVSVFGDEAPNDNSCSKLITVDENKIAHVQYVTREGEVIATCLMNNGELESEEGSTISSSGSGNLLNLEGEAINTISAIRTVTSGTMVDPYTIQSSKNFTLLQPTTVTLEYILHPKNFGILGDCGAYSYCTNCDYRVNIRIINVETSEVVWPTSSTNPLYIVNPTSCSPGSTSMSATTVLLPAGSYTIERVVENNHIDGASTPPMTELDKHTIHVLSGIPSLETIFSTIFGSTATTASLRLADYRSYLATTATYSLVGTCRFLTLPNVSCPDEGCDDPPKYEQYLFKEMGLDEAASTTASLNRYFKNKEGSDKYPTTSATFQGIFNTMIAHMKADGWDCRKLWKNWVSAVQLYLSTPETSLGSGHRQRDGHDIDLLETFLDLNGRSICGTSATMYGSGGYLEYAYKYFYYFPGMNNVCEHAVGYSTAWVNGSGCANWQALYNCVKSGQTTISSDAKTEGGIPTIDCPRPSTYYDPSVLPIPQEWKDYFDCARTLLDKMESDCKSSCENMRPVFEDAIRKKYKDAQEDVSDFTVYCLVEALVKNCEDGCGLTLTPTTATGSWSTPAFSISASRGIDGFSRRMLGQFSLAFPSCSPPYTLAENTTSALDALITYLNKVYQDYRKTLSSPTYIYFDQIIKDFYTNAGMTVPKCIEDSKTFKDKFYLKVYPLTTGFDGKFFRMKEQQQGGATTCTCTLEFDGEYPLIVSAGTAEKLNAYLDHSWGKVINSITPTGIVRTAAMITGPGSQPDHYAHAFMPLPAPGGRDSLADTTDAFASRTVYPDSTLLAGLPIFVSVPGAGDLVFNTVSGLVTTTTTDLFSFNKTGSPDSGVWRAFGTIAIQFPRRSPDDPVNRLVVRLTRDSVDGSGLLKTVRLEHSYGVSEKEEVINSVSVLPNTLTTYMGNSYTTTIGKFSADTVAGTLIYTNLGKVQDVTVPPFPLKGHYTVKFDCDDGGMCKTDNCGICIEWHDPIPVTTDGVTVFHEMDCAEQQLVEARRQLKEQYEAFITELRKELIMAYRGSCLGAANINDELTLSYGEKYYHYMLYYHDRAGHLVRTVPPLGVDLSGASSRTRASHPAHTLQTEYDYNSLGQLERQYTPDGGETTYEYNTAGQLRFSQNAVQVTTGTYSYTKYDRLGRVTEVGQYTGSISGLHDVATAPTSGTDQVTRMVYSTPASSLPTPYGSLAQENLQNRISYAVYDGNTSISSDEVTTYYSYDVHGNVQWIIQDIPGLGASKTDYEYDLISGNMKQVKYRDGYSDRFYHRFDYDMDSRLVKVETSHDSVLWEKDASYEYYGHGPMRRVAIGEDSVQGVDYVYTLQGWLKGINHPSLAAANDPGGDGNSIGSGLTKFGKDVFGMELGYYSGDFNRSSSVFNSGNTYNLAPGYSLYNGNITSWSTNIVPSGAGSTYFEHLVGNTFHYDVLNRLREDQFNDYVSGWSATNSYNTSYSYDGNGNITTLKRYAWNGSSAQLMDDLTYKLTQDVGGSKSNKLKQVVDAGVTGFTNDIKTQSSNDNYRYDNAGRLTGDHQGILKNTWNGYNKVTEVATSSGKIVYSYDAMGNRVKKEEYTGSTLSKTTWYVSDASGQVMSIYEKEGSGNIVQKEVPLYGAGRLGEALPGETRSNTAVNDASGLFNRYIDKKEYELTDHLGNVRAVIGDVKKDDNAGSFSVWFKAYNNYYPFGMLQPNRSWQSVGYRYGYNGVEQENGVQGNSNLLATDFRMYDPRLGRWWGRDPIVKTWESPYAGMGNNPIVFSDPSGLDETGLDLGPTPNSGNPGPQQGRGVVAPGSFSTLGAMAGFMNMDNARSIAKGVAESYVSYAGKFASGVAEGALHDAPQAAVNTIKMGAWLFGTKEGWNVLYGYADLWASQQLGRPPMTIQGQAVAYNVVHMFRSVEENVSNIPNWGPYELGRFSGAAIDGYFVPRLGLLGDIEEGIATAGPTGIGELEPLTIELAPTQESNIALGYTHMGLDEFAENIGGFTWKQWGAENFQSQFLDVINNPVNKIHFNLDGIDNPWTAITKGAKGYGKSDITHWELYQVYSHPEALGRTTFYRNGEIVPNPF